MTQLNIETARFNMVEQQVRPWDVLDPQVLDVISQLPREEFVPEAYRNLAYADIAIPLPGGEVMMKPVLEGRLLQALEIQGDDRVLEVGTGSGYLTACLAKLANQVVSVDINGNFTDAARGRLSDLGIDNVTLETGDAANGWGEQGPYDAIAVTGSIPLHEDQFLRELKIGGRLFVIIGDAPLMEATLITRTGEESWSREVLFETEIQPLQNASQPDRFAF